MNHIAIFDIGKTNKKAFVFDEDYRIVFEQTIQLPETADDDGYPCEDISLLQNWLLETARALLHYPDFNIKAFNCTAYGASFVHLDTNGQPVAPIYNYLKPFPEALKNRFLEKYGPAEKICLETASPWLGHLNSGLQLYWLKHTKPFIFNKIHTSLHLPQWLARLLTGAFQPSTVHPVRPDRPGGRQPSTVTEMTSLGCHTMLWDFRKNDYHDWVKAEGIVEKFPPIVRPETAVQPTGLHDSSAALIPYMACFREPFVLISTGTWCISLNPFNDEPLTAAELARDCLCYLTPAGKPVKAARYFGGHEHDEAVKKIATDYGVPPEFYKIPTPANDGGNFMDIQNALDAYTGFMRELVARQVASTRLAIGQSPVRRIFVDGGFSKNELYMRLLAAAFPEMEVFAAELAQATALGAALAVREEWNEKEAWQPTLPLHLFQWK